MQADDGDDPQSRDGRKRGRGQPRRAPQPLDRARLEELALAYVARFATSTGKLERYLQRKLRERGWAGEGEPPIAAIVARHAELGYVDDAAFARSKAGGLLRRGYGPRRVGQALGEAGIDEPLRRAVQPDETGRRQAALHLARKRGFGPFGSPSSDPRRREKQIAAMLRAGHMLAEIRAVIDAPDGQAAERWADAASDDETGDES